MSETEASTPSRRSASRSEPRKLFPTASSVGSSSARARMPARRPPMPSTVTLKVSLGPERFQAPSFIGLTRGAAEDRAAEYGLQVSVTDLPGGTGRGDHPEPRAGRDGQLRRHDPALPAVRFGAHVRRGSEATTGVVQQCRRRGAGCAQVFVSNPRLGSTVVLRRGRRAVPRRLDDERARSAGGPRAVRAEHASPNRGFLARPDPRSTYGPCL